jgi:hypothetical protein
LVRQASNAWAAEPVDIVDALEQVEAAFENAVDVLVDHLGCLEDAFGLVEVALDSLVLLAGEVIGDGAGDDTTSEPPTFGGELFNTVTGAADFGLGSFVLIFQLGAEAVLDQLLDAGRDAHGSPVALDGRFHGVHVQVGLLAAGLALVSAEAEEVGVAAFGQSEGQATAALPAVDRALQVVVMDTLLFARHVMGDKYLLHLVEDGLDDVPGTEEAVGAGRRDGDLAQGAGQPWVAFAAALVLVPASRFVDLWAELGLGHQVGVGREAAHVQANIGDPLLPGGGTDRGD